MSDNGRDKHGRFQVGNAGGPGRPRRAIEREYIGAVSEAVSIDDWRGIISKAREDALAGDHQARQWLTHFLIGDERISLTQLAALEHLGLSADLEVAGLADMIQNPPSAWMANLGPEETPIDRALNLLNQERQAQVERIEKEVERRKAARAGAQQSETA